MPWSRSIDVMELVVLISETASAPPSTTFSRAYTRDPDMRTDRSSPADRAGRVSRQNACPVRARPRAQASGRSPGHVGSRGRAQGSAVAGRVAPALEKAVKDGSRDRPSQVEPSELRPEPPASDRVVESNP